MARRSSDKPIRRLGWIYCVISIGTTYLVISPMTMSRCFFENNPCLLQCIHGCREVQKPSLGFGTHKGPLACVVKGMESSRGRLSWFLGFWSIRRLGFGCRRINEVAYTFIILNNVTYLLSSSSHSATFPIKSSLPSNVNFVLIIGLFRLG